MSEIDICTITADDQGWIAELLTENWGSTIVISRGKSQDASKLPGFVALYQDAKVGLVTYRIKDKECELVTLDSWRKNAGVGTYLIEAVQRAALKAGCSHLWLITTNDNLHALGFYQKRGFQLTAIRPNVMSESRKIKPSIPEIGMNGIPIRDEIELQIRIN